MRRGRAYAPCDPATDVTALRIGDAAVTRCDITFPRRGVWCADVDLDTETAPTGRVSVVVDGGPTWSGTVVSGGVSHGLWSGRIVGGAGGLRNVLDDGADGVAEAHSAHPRVV